LEQGGREVYLKPGEMSIYDATQAHKITMPEQFSKILISIPRHLLIQRISNVANVTATKLDTKQGIGAVASSLIHSTVRHLHQFSQQSFLDLSEHVLDLLTLSLRDSNTRAPELSNHRGLLLQRVKTFIASNLNKPNLDAIYIANAVGLSIRYINELFSEENTSLMRYVTQQRIELIRGRLAHSAYKHYSITELAMQCGFNNMAHFSRVFKEKYGVSPRMYRNNKRLNS